MVWALLPIALLGSCAVAYAAHARLVLARERRTLQAVLRREALTGDAARTLADAARRSLQHVLRALERALQQAEPAVDALLVLRPELDDLRCIYAGGARANYYRELRVRRDAVPSGTQRTAKGLIPTDAAAVCIALHAGDTLLAQVYVSSTAAVIDREAIVRVAEQAAAPFAIAAEREVDRAQATFDGLTGLYTPRAFRDKLRADIDAARAGSSGSFALWFIDTDDFKRVNDTLGHAAGDQVLQQMAALLREHVSAAHDVIARNGGDEFCVVLRDVPKLAAIERAQAFCAAVRAHKFGAAGRRTVSVGVAAFPYDAADAAELLEAADAAMYHSKHAGRDRVSFCRQGGFTAYAASAALAANGMA